MTPTTTCKTCGATYRVTDIHWCRRTPQPEPASPLFVVAAVVFLCAIVAVCGWAIYMGLAR